MTVDKAGHATEKRVFRNQETTFLSTAFGILFAILGIFALLGPGPVFIRLPWGLLLIGAALAFHRRGGSQGIYLDDQGVEVKGGFTTKRVRWEEIERFELQRGLRDLATRIHLKDGTSVPARALNAGTGILPSMVRRAEAQVEELNRILAERRGVA